MPFLPLFLDLSTGPVILTGAGPAALAKLERLRARGAAIHWYPLNAKAALPAEYANAADVTILAGEPPLAAIKGAVAVVAASGGDADERVARRAGRLRVPVNAVDRPDISTFVFPAIVDRGDVIVAIGTSGTAPVLARRLREQIEAILPARIGELAALMGRWRRRLRAQAGAGATDRQWWERFVDSPIAQAVLDGRAGEAEAWFASLARRQTLASKSRLGSVALVGAGPGDPDLLTLKALRALQDADVVFYDDLVSPEILDRVRRDASKIFVGKRKGEPGEGQDSINRRLIAAARGGARVVRLKGGDPFVFGRGGEEMEVLRAAGIPVTVVPGVTAALGCAAEAQIPLTFRNEATRIVCVTAQRADDREDIDWHALTDPRATLVFYMGLSAAATIRDRLIEAGRDPATPAAVLARGTRPDARTIVGYLDELPAMAERVDGGPALIVVGAVVAHGKAWRNLRVAAGDRVAVPA